MISETKEFEVFFKQFIATGLWASNDYNGDSLEGNYTIDDISKAGIEIFKAHCVSFYSRCYYYLECEEGNKTPSDLGHDFFLTSARHGAGFWDGDWITYGDLLTKLSECYPEEWNIAEYIDAVDNG